MEHIFNSPKSFKLESGVSIPQLEIVYSTYGNINKKGDNVIWVCHALTANSNVFDWWKGLFGEEDLFNPKDFFIVCANNLGSCYGSSGPLSIHPFTKEPWNDYFPEVTIKDMVNALDLLKIHLGINKIHSLIGGSQGGQIALEWSLKDRLVAENLILIATNALHSPWGIAFNESQRMAIKADRTYHSQSPDAAKKGLAAARSIALLSYRGYNSYQIKQSEVVTTKRSNFKASSYQRHQGEKLVNRFNAYSYIRLLNAMDSHHVARKRAETAEDALKQISAKTLVISIANDILFPPAEQEFLAKHIPHACHEKIESDFGHDGFLLETKKLSELIQKFYGLQKHKTARSENLILKTFK